MNSADALPEDQCAAAHALLLPLVPLLSRSGNTALHRRGTEMPGTSGLARGRLEKAARCLREALELAAIADDPLTVGRATNDLGMIAHLRGTREAGLALYHLAVPAYQRVGHPAGLAETHHNMALVLRDLGHLDAADKQERRAITFAREAGSARLAATARVSRAALALERGEPVIAHAGARLGAEEFAAIPDARGEAEALRLMGAAATAMGNYSLAGEALTRALDLARRHGSALVEAETHDARAHLHVALGHWDRAAEDVTAARKGYHALGATAAEERLIRWHQGVRGQRA